MQDNEKKILICKSIAKVLKKLRGNQSQFKFCSENNISTSIISNIERGVKDPQLTTLFKIAEALGIKTSEFIEIIEKELPKDLNLTDK